MVLGTIFTFTPKDATVVQQAEAGCYRLLRIMALFYRDARFAATVSRSNQHIRIIPAVNHFHANNLVRNASVHYRKIHGVETGHNRLFVKLRDGNVEHLRSPYRVVKR